MFNFKILIINIKIIFIPCEFKFVTKDNIRNLQIIKLVCNNNVKRKTKLNK